MRQAFTLIELSIVLIIIGLLVGGILVARDLIESAKIRSQISQIGEYRTAINTFNLTYDAYPGDMDSATDIWGAAAAGVSCLTTAGTGIQTCNGDGSGALAYSWLGDSSDVEWEPYTFWEHLANAELIAGTYTGVGDAVCSGGANHCPTPDVNIPSGAFSGSGVMAFSSRTWGDFSWLGRVRNPLRALFGIGNPDNHAGGFWHGPALTTQQAYILDTKMDDGMPYVGSVTNMSGTNAAWAPLCTAGGADNRAVLTTEYDLGYTAIACTPFIDIQAMP